MHSVPLNDFPSRNDFRGSALQKNYIPDIDLLHGLITWADECHSVAEEKFFITTITPLRPRRNLPVFFAHFQSFLLYFVFMHPAKR